MIVILNPAKDLLFLRSASDVALIRSFSVPLCLCVSVGKLFITSTESSPPASPETPLSLPSYLPSRSTRRTASHPDTTPRPAAGRAHDSPPPSHTGWPAAHSR